VHAAGVDDHNLSCTEAMTSYLKVWNILLTGFQFFTQVSFLARLGTLGCCLQVAFKSISIPDSNSCGHSAHATVTHVWLLGWHEQLKIWHRQARSCWSCRWQQRSQRQV